MKVLFWNTGKQKIDDLLAHLACQNKIDLIVLAEYDESENRFLELANKNEPFFEEIPQIGCGRITIFIRKGIATFRHGPETNYYTSKILGVGFNLKILMVAVHLPSKLYQDESTQTLEASEFKKEIEKIENKLDIEKSFIIGDFNMNPFEKGMVGASAFHSIPCENTSLSKQRIIKERSHKFFYNPMWNLLGDFDDNPGSYFYRSSEQVVYFWNIFDQIILRPTITKFFVKESLCILRSIGDSSLVSTIGKPSISDHLPISFKFNFSRSI